MIKEAMAVISVLVALMSEDTKQVWRDKKLSS
jgi:hypothetical protein